MANRRMFSLDVVDTDLFLEMPATSQSLYFHLGVRADDDGFVSSPKKITKMVNCGEDDLNVLVSRGFVIPMEGGVIVIRHWRQNNTIRSDRYTPTVYQKQFASLTENNGVYDLNSASIPDGRQVVDGRDTQVRIGEDREGKDREEKDRGEEIRESENGTAPADGPLQLFDLYSGEYAIGPLMMESLRSWITYRQEAGDSFGEQTIKSLLSQAEKNSQRFGEEKVCDLVEICISGNWKSIRWEKLGEGKQKSNADKVSSRVSEVDNW